MTFLPIVERELRVAARRHLTYWTRVGSAGTLLIIFGLMFSVAMISRGMGWSFGQVIFSVLKWVAFALTALSGIFIPSDSLSEEKREGTLGLLFLTDLRGYDVVLGKLISLSLQSFYGLLAAFPILALPLMMGGVTGTEFTRTILVMCNTLFLSLAIGLFVSSMSREVLKAMNAAGALTLLFLIGLPWGDMALAHWDSTKWKCILSMASPGYLFTAASALRPADYWECLLVQNWIAWSLLAAACVIVPRAWQEKSNEKTGGLAALAKRWRFGGTKARLAFRRKFIGRAPILWLALRDRWLARFALLVTLLVLCGLGYNMYINWANNPLQSITDFSVLFNFGVALWLASQACRLYVEAVRSGAMELILVSPMPPEQIVRSQWKALVRTFLVPVLLLLALRITSDIETIIQLKKSYASMKMAAKSAGAWTNYDWITRQTIQMIGNLLNFLLWMAALAWFGMWMGLKNRKVPIAILMSILFVCLIPWFFELFVMGWTMALLAHMKLPFWLGMVPSIVFEAAKNIFFILWSRKRLMTRFRETVVRTGQAPRPRLKFLPRPVPVQAATPPLVS
ncbi:MAG TPA: hypothetical protein VG754_04550 [Verrucomicrobiae bacterium]|nr:hypothetical protein [Verrucomicrobiae bacterium]